MEILTRHQALYPCLKVLKMPHKYTTENITWLSANRPNYAERELSQKFFEEFKVLISPAALAQQCHKRGIKPPAINIGRIKKGNVPFNKRKKGIRVSMTTEFKKGNKPKNTLPVGTEVFSKDYWYVKTAEPNTWTAKHRVIWESVNGKIPNGSSIIFLDSNVNNFDVTNLDIVTKSELLQMNRNKYKQINQELKPSLLALSKLETKIYKLNT